MHLPLGNEIVLHRALLLCDGNVVCDVTSEGWEKNSWFYKRYKSSCALSHRSGQISVHRDNKVTRDVTGERETLSLSLSLSLSESNVVLDVTGEKPNSVSCAAGKETQRASRRPGCSQKHDSCTTLPSFPGCRLRSFTAATTPPCVL